MKNEYQDLPHRTLSSGTLITQKKRGEAVKFSLEDPAFSMMTDFKHGRPFSTTSTATIEEINQKMIDCGVRLLFVADSYDALLGLVTYNDIFGEKPVRYLQENGGKREEINAQDIMTHLEHLEALEIDEVLKARIGDIVETMRLSGRQHILVVERQSDGPQALSGLFSSTEIEKRLNIKIELSPRANTFADLERALT